jgi:hypothetical protein
MCQFSSGIGIKQYDTAASSDNAFDPPLMMQTVPRTDHPASAVQTQEEESFVKFLAATQPKSICLTTGGSL